MLSGQTGYADMGGGGSTLIVTDSHLEGLGPLNDVLKSGCSFKMVYVYTIMNCSCTTGT